MKDKVMLVGTSCAHRLAAFTVCVALSGIALVQGATITVSNGNDAGTGSLRQAVLDSPPDGTINFDSSVHQIHLTSPIQLTKNVVVAGPGAAALSIDEPKSTQCCSVKPVFVVSQGKTVSISNLTITGADTAVDNNGSTTLDSCVLSNNGGLALGIPGLSNRGNLTLNQCQILNGAINVSLAGSLTVKKTTVSGGLQGFSCKAGSITISDSTITGCSSPDVSNLIYDGGGGLHNEGTAIVSNTTISGNSMPQIGGGIYNSGNLTLTTCTIANNQSGEGLHGGGIGGGIYNQGRLAITNCTISGNRATGGFNHATQGGGIYSNTNTGFTVANSTIVFNNARGSGTFGGSGGGLHANNVAMKSTILALNLADNSYDGNCTVQSDGYNLIGDNGGGAGPGVFIAPQQTDHVGTHTNPINPVIGSLRDNGGPTFTHALLDGSLATNNGAPDSPNSDQRGYTRNGTPDIGSFEFNGPIGPPPTNGTVGNISTRSVVQTDNNVMIAGIIIQGGGKRVLVRAIGPSLSAFGINNPLPDPTLELHDSSGTLLASNDDWQTTIVSGVITSDQAADIQNSGLAPTNPKEAAMIVILAGGNYTAIVRGANATTGVGVVEVYGL